MNKCQDTNQLIPTDYCWHYLLNKIIIKSTREASKLGQSSDIQIKLVQSKDIQIINNQSYFNSTICSAGKNIN